MPETTDQSTQSFTEYADAMHDKDRSVAVFVEGNFRRDPQRGNAAATRIAHYLCDDEEEVLKIAPGEATDTETQKPDDLGAIQVRLLPTTDKEDWLPVQQRLLSRVPRDTDIVILVDGEDVPWFAKDLCDVRVVAGAMDSPLEFYRVKLDHWAGDVYYHEMTGFHGDTDGN